MIDIQYVGWLVQFYSKSTLRLFYAEDFLKNFIPLRIVGRDQLSGQLSVSVEGLNIHK